MSSEYTPTPVQLVQMLQPSDGDTKPAASVQVGMQGLANGVAAGPTVPFNWQPSGTTTNNLKRGSYSKKDQAWFGVGDGGNDFLEVSYSSGRKWTNLASSLGSLLPCVDVAMDQAGNGVILTTGSTKVYKGSWTAYGSITWAMNTNLHNTVTDGRICWDQSHSVWAVIYRTGASGIIVETSPNGTTWTQQTVTTAFSGYTGTTASPRIFCSPTGTMISAFHDSATDITHIMRSTNGGSTWTEVADITGAFAGATVSIAQDPVLGAWYVSVTIGSPSRKTDFFTSTNDGVTWTYSAAQSFTTQDMALVELAVLASAVVAMGDDGRVFYNPAGGVAGSWFLVTTNPITSAALPGMRVGDGQLMVWNPSDKTSYASLRYGGVGNQVA